MNQQSGKVSDLSHKEIKSHMRSIGLWTFFGCSIGFLKDILLARFLGVTGQADAFFLALRVPNMLRGTLAEGSIPGALLPFAAQMLKVDQRQRVRQVLSLVLFALLLAIGGLWLGIFSWSSQILKFVAPGLEPLRLEFCAQFLILLFPLILFFSLSSAVGTILQAANNFKINSAGAAIFNLAIILSLLLGLKFNFTVTMLCGGFLLAGFAKLWSRVIVLGTVNLLPMLPSERQNFIDFFLIAKRFTPLAAGVGLTFLNTCFETQLASFLPTGQISLIHYMFRIFNVFIYVISHPIENTIFPQISRLEPTKINKYNFYLCEILKLVLILGLPVSIFIITLADEIVLLLLGSSATLAQAKLAASLLRCLCLGACFNILNRILSQFFFSRHNTFIPTLIWGITVFFSAAAGYALIFWANFEALGIILAATSSWALAFFGKLFLLDKKYQIQVQWESFWSFLKAFLRENIPAVAFLGASKYWFIQLKMAQSSIKIGLFLLVTSTIFYTIIILCRNKSTNSASSSSFLDAN